MTQALAISGQSSIVTPPSSIEGWLPVPAVARLLGITDSAVRKACGAGRMAATMTDSGWMIDPACRAELRIATHTETCLHAVSLADSDLSHLSARQRQQVHERMTMIEKYISWESDKPIGDTLGHVQNLFCDAWTAAHPQNKVCAPTLRKYIRKYRRGGIAGLVDRRADNGRNNTMSPEAGEFILGLYAQQQREHLPKIHELAVAMAARNGWIVPGLKAVQEWIRKRDRKLILCGRDPKRFRDRCTPHILRDATKIAAMQLIVGDHHQFDILWPRRVYIDGKAGKPGRCEWKWFRPWLSAWLDFRSWHLYSHSIAFDSPDGDRVMGSFLQGVLEHGQPDHLYLDNGKDYRMQRFAGGRKRPAKDGEQIVARRHVEPILTMLGIGVTWATPYNAKAKIIEPWFGIVEERFGKSFETYVGNKPDRRPERMKKMMNRSGDYAARFFAPETLERLATLTDKYDQERRDALCLESFSSLFDQWITADYSLRKSPAAGACGLSAREAFLSLRAKDFSVRRPDESTLAVMLMPSMAVSVSQNGVWVKPFGCYYWSGNLESLRCNGQRSKITYRFNPSDSSKVYIFDAADKFLDVATPYVGMGMHPLASVYGTEADKQKLSDAIYLQRSCAKNTRRQVRELQSKAQRMLGASASAADELGLLDKAVAPDAALPTLRIVPALTAAAQAGADVEERRAKSEERKMASDFFLTGTDGPAADGRHHPTTALDLIAGLEELCDRNPESEHDSDPESNPD